MFDEGQPETERSQVFNHWHWSLTEKAVFFKVAETISAYDQQVCFYRILCFQNWLLKTKGLRHFTISANNLIVNVFQRFTAIQNGCQALIEVKTQNSVVAATSDSLLNILQIKSS